MREPINSRRAPAAIGTYSQAIRHGNTVYISGQIPLDPTTGEMVDGDISAQIDRVLRNLAAICATAGGDLDHILKLNVYLTDLGNFNQVNELMEDYFEHPYPARAAVQVSALPKGAQVEMDAVMGIDPEDT